jgi:hypothetical protein
MDLISPLPWQMKRPATEAQVEAEAAAFFEVMGKTGGEV